MKDRNNNRKWSPAHASYLSEHVGIERLSTIASRLGRTEASIETQARRMGLKVPTQRIEARARRPKPVPMDIDSDSGRCISVLPPEAPGYGPTIVHRIAS